MSLPPSAAWRNAFLNSHETNSPHSSVTGRVTAEVSLRKGESLHIKILHPSSHLTFTETRDMGPGGYVSSTLSGNSPTGSLIVNYSHESVEDT